MKKMMNKAGSKVTAVTQCEFPDKWEFFLLTA